MGSVKRRKRNLLQNLYSSGQKNSKFNYRLKLDSKIIIDICFIKGIIIILPMFGLATLEVVINLTLVTFCGLKYDARKIKTWMYYNYSNKFMS